jgi:hypothetical protein
MDLHKYLTGLLRHGWDESWLPELTMEQVAAIAALANQELLARLNKEPPHE